MTHWIVVNIGCIECGVPSNIVGVFTDERRAREIADHLDVKMAWRKSGQNSFEAFPMPQLDVITEEYRAAFEPGFVPEDPDDLEPTTGTPAVNPASSRL